MCANGPLAWSVLAFNHAMIFHSYVPWMQRKNNWITTPSTSYVHWFIFWAALLCRFVPRGVFDFAVQAHMTSVVVHVSPLLLSYGLRWYAAPVSDISMGATHFRICDGDAESCLNVSFSTLLFGTMTQFYLWWLILYYVWIFVALGSYIERHAYQTLWDRILVGFSMRGLACQKLSKYIQTIPQRHCAIHFLKDLTHMLS